VIGFAGRNQLTAERDREEPRVVRVQIHGDRLAGTTTRAASALLGLRITSDGNRLRDGFWHVVAFANPNKCRNPRSAGDSCNPGRPST
jgi:hypothetical protein